MDDQSFGVPLFLKSIYLSHPALQDTSCAAQLVETTDTSPSSGATTTTAHATGPIPLYLPPPAVPQLEEALVPPENFAMVCPGVYRSGFPKKRNFRFLEGLGLKTVL